MDFVNQRPGVRISDVAEHFLVAHSTATYNLLALGRLGLLRRERDGRDVRHYAVGAGAAASLAAWRRDHKKLSLLEALAKLPVERLTINQISKQTHLSYGYVRRTMFQLMAAGLLDMHRQAFQYQVRSAEKFRQAWEKLEDNVRT